ncbi:MAG: DUF4340 domain-containing protein [Nitrospirales bacterium]
MLNPIRISVVLGLIVLGLGAYILFIDIPQTRQIEQHIKQDRQILPFDDRAVTRMLWASKTDTIELARDDQFRWSIINPIQSPADNQEIRRLLRALTIGKIKRTIEGEDGHPLDLSEYGLAPPYLTLTLSTPSESVEFSLGDRGPFAPSLYVQTKPDNQVVLTTLDVMTFAQKNLTNFRLKDLLLFDRERVQEIRIQNKYGEIMLQRVAGVHSLTPNWMFLSPNPGPADKTTITTLLMELDGLRAIGFVDPEQEKIAIRQQEAKSHAAITLMEGSLIHHLDIFQYGDAEKTFAVKTSNDPLYEIPPNILGPLTRDPFYFQDKRLFGLEVADLAMLSVQTPDERYVLIHQHDEWVLEDNPSATLDQNVLNLFISRVVDVPAEIYLPRAESEDGHIQSPTAIIRGVNRQGKELGKLVLGKREKGLVLAEGAGLKGLYQVRSTILDQLPSKASLLQGQ